MRSTVNHLVQLQELTLIRDEQRSIRGAGADLGEINRSIDAMAGSLEPAVKVVRDRLYKKDHIVMAPMNDGSCSMCGMKLAISVVQAVKLCRTIVTCPSCARILYDPTGSAKWVAERPKRSTGEHKSGVARFSAPELMLPDLKADTPEAAIAELAGLLEAGHFVDDAAKLVEAAVARENTVPTGVGRGLAFPHVRGVEGGGLSLAFGVSRKGIAWGGADDAPVHFVFFSTIPTAVSAFYLRLLAGLSESYAKEPCRKLALEAADAPALWKALVKATRSTVK